MIQQKKDEAVSPVVGVMLMLVVTIVIAAVVAAFAGGIGGNVEKTPTIAFDVKMDDSGLLLTCIGADTQLIYGTDFTIYVNKPSALDTFTEEGLNVSRTTSGNGIAFAPGKSIYYSMSDLQDAYLDLNTKYSGYNGGSNKCCWTWGGSNGAVIGLPVKVKLISPTGKVLAQATGTCTRTS